MAAPGSPDFSRFIREDPKCAVSPPLTHPPGNSTPTLECGLAPDPVATQDKAATAPEMRGAPRREEEGPPVADILAQRESPVLSCRKIHHL